MEAYGSLRKAKPPVRIALARLSAILHHSTISNRSSTVQPTLNNRLSIQDLASEVRFVQLCILSVSFALLIVRVAHYEQDFRFRFCRFLCVLRVSVFKLLLPIVEALGHFFGLKLV
jgi:hypothetical protein